MMIDETFDSRLPKKTIACPVGSVGKVNDGRAYVQLAKVPEKDAIGLLIKASKYGTARAYESITGLVVSLVVDHNVTVIEDETIVGTIEEREE